MRSLRDVVGSALTLGALTVGALLVTACDGKAPGSGEDTASARASGTANDTVQAAAITQQVANDSDDPAIWIDRANPSASRIVGTDKGDSTGGLYVFTLDGQIDSARTRRPLRRPNNVAIAQDVDLGHGRLDIAVATERGAMAIRVFRLPDMTPIDGGGLPVFDGDSSRAPMGVALYRRPRDGAVFAFVGGKSGPTDGYLWQYQLTANAAGQVSARKVRAVGRYSGKKEIEAIAVDAALGFLYYSDETVGVRKYYADADHPDANTELALFADRGFVSDHEGIAVYPTSDSTGYLLVSDQQGQRLQVFRREGAPGAPHRHEPIAVIPVSAMETDGLDVVADSLSPRFPRGVLVMMSTDRTFHLFDWRDIAARLPR